MTSDSVHSVIAAEKEIRARVAAETKKADDWLTRQREALIQERNRQLLELKKQYARERKAAGKRAEEEARAIAEQARALERRYRNLDSDQLHDLLKKHLNAILPGNTP